jgi:hypothetical protein
VCLSVIAKPHQERSWPVIVSKCQWRINTYPVQLNYCRRVASCLVKLHYVIALKQGELDIRGCHHGISACRAAAFVKCKGKAVPLQVWSGPEGSRKLRFPDFMTTAQDGGESVKLTHRPPLPPRNTSGNHFC